MAHNVNMLKGLLELLIFRVLEDEDRYAFELSDLIAEYSGGKLVINNATLYPTLYRLKERGYISLEERVVARRTRKYYHLQSVGREYFEKIKQDYLYISSGVQSALGYLPKREE
jgi:DNA-binding PadR family transcriptional regulator